MGGLQGPGVKAEADARTELTSFMKNKVTEPAVMEPVNILFSPQILSEVKFLLKMRGVVLAAVDRS